MSKSSYDKVRAYEQALHKIASWPEGPVVSSQFDEPCAAQAAREALARSGVAPPLDVFTFELSRNAGHKLTHVAETDADGRPVRVLCKRVKATSLRESSVSTTTSKPPTCQVCAWRLSCRGAQ